MTATLADVPKQLAAKPHLVEELVTFIDHWGLDHYDPPDSTISAVRQIVHLAVVSVPGMEREYIKQDCDHVWQPHDAYGENCINCGSFRSPADIE